MRYIYEVTKSKPNGESKDAFGIKAVDSQTGSEEVIENIFTSEAQAQQLAATCSRLQVSIIHIKDVVEDAILNI